MANPNNPIPCPASNCPGPVLADNGDGLWHPSEIDWREPLPCPDCGGYGVVEAEA